MLHRLSFLAVLLTLPLFAHAWQPGGVPICTDLAGQGSPCNTKTTDGFVICWTDARAGAFTDIYAQKLDAEGRSLWTLDGVVVCEQESTQNTLLVVSGFNGSAIFLWEDYRYLTEFRHPFLYGQRLGPDGRGIWTPNGILFNDDGGSYSAVLIPDGAGGVFHAELQTGVTPYDYQIAVLTRVDSSGIGLWRKVLSRSTVGLSLNPRIISDGVTGVIASWRWMDTTFAQRFSPTGQEVWIRGGINFGRIDISTFVLDATNGAIFTWSDGRNGTWDIYAQRVAGDGSVRWQTNGIPVRVAPGTQANPKAVPDGAGGAIVVWEDGASGLRDIYAQRLDSTGARLWDTLGVPVIRSTGDQTGIQVVSDDAGGVIVAWKDNRNGNSDIYAQRLNPSGQRLWDTLGVEICVWNGEQTVPVMCPDGSGGAVIAWQDTRNGNNDIYAQRVTASGSGVWEEPSPSRLSPYASRLTVSPNPVVSFTSVPGRSSERFALYDISGRKVGTYQGDRIGQGLPPGVYFLRETGGGSPLARIVKVR